MIVIQFHSIMVQRPELKIPAAKYSKAFSK
jgi:hypothetical protein